MQEGGAGTPNESPMAGTQRIARALPRLAWVLTLGAWALPGCNETGVVAPPVLAKAPRAPGLSRTIVATTTVHPPGHPEGAKLTVLATGARDGQPTGTTLWLGALDGSGPGRCLSPEPGYNFWSVSAGDVDGDGAEDLGLCTWSRTAHEPEYKRRFFVYGWTAEGDLKPMWRGSRLCRPYTAARLMDVTGDEVAELVSVEIGLGGGKLICAYEWNQFGFWGIGKTEEYESVTPPAAGDLDGRAGPELVSAVTDGRRHYAAAFRRGDGRLVMYAQGGPVRPTETLTVQDGRVLARDAVRAAGQAPAREIAFEPCEGSEGDD